MGGTTRFMADVTTVDELSQVITNAKTKGIPFFILGSGSNVIARDDEYTGLIIRVRIPGFEIISEDYTTVTIKLGAGEIWDEVVAQTVDKGLIGIEAMSDIPSYCGAAPVQNIGAYGQEIADTLVSLEAYDTTANQVVTLTNEECKFTYRDSIFRTEAQGRYIITSITLQLYKAAPEPPFYKGVQDYFDEHNITIYTAKPFAKQSLRYVTRNYQIQSKSQTLDRFSKTPSSSSGSSMNYYRTIQMLPTMRWATAATKSPLAGLLNNAASRASYFMACVSILQMRSFSSTNQPQATSIYPLRVQR